MTIVFALLLQAIPDDVRVGLSVDPPTVEEQTYPQYDFDCRLTLTRGGEARLQFQQTGARGYIDENESDPFSRVKQTPALLRIVTDSANVLSGYRLNSYYGPGFGKIRGENESNGLELDLQRTDVRGLEAVVVRVGGVYSTVSAIGLCEIDETRQRPLTAAETSEIASQ